MKPLFQLAIDITNEDSALKIAKAVEEFVDIIEAGTPLIKAQGIRIVTELKKLYPNKKIVADLKIADIGALEAGLAFKAGADLITVLGCASPSTIEAAILQSNLHGKEVVVDLVCPVDKLALSRRILPLNPHYICVHTGIDEQLKGKTLFEEVRRVSKLNIPLVVAGGINLHNIENLAPFKPSIIIVGGAITTSRNPSETAKSIREKIDHFWPNS